MNPLDCSEFAGLLESLFPGEEWDSERARVIEYLSARGAFSVKALPARAAKHMTNPLTTRGEVIAYVWKRNLEGVNPTLREIVENTSLQSTSAVSYIVDHLYDDGILDRGRGRARTIRIKESA